MVRNLYQARELGFQFAQFGWTEIEVSDFLQREGYQNGLASVIESFYLQQLGILAL